MENWQKVHIQSHLDKLIKVTDCSVELLTVLESKHIFSANDVETLSVRKQNEGKLAQSKLLYDILITRIGSYDILIKALWETKQTGSIHILCEAIFQHRKVYFQGQTVSMTEIMSLAKINPMSVELFEKTIDITALLTLVDDKTEFVLATDTIPEPLPYYISRTLSYRSRLSVEAFKEAVNDVFVFEGINRTQLTEIAMPNHTDVSGSQLDQNKLTSRFILLELAQDFRELCKISEVSIHLIMVHDGNFYWKKSNGSLSLIQQHVHKYQDEVSEIEFLENISRKTESICISDTPGMGKTVLLANIARALKKVQSQTLTFFFPFYEFIQQLFSQSKLLNVASVIRNISALGSKTSIGKYLLQRILENKAVKFNLFLDGYDEILPEHFQLAKKVLSVVTKSIQNCQVFITTRPHLRSELEVQLETLSINISLFRESHQIDFIVKYWGQSIDKATNQDSVLHFGRFCLRSLQSCLSDTERVMAGIPLQCMLLADICLPKLLRYLETKETLPSVASSLFSMYEQLIDIRFKKAENEQVRQQRGSYKAKLFYNSMVGKRQWKRRVIDYHILAAIRILFPERSPDFEPMLLGKSNFDSNIHINVIGLLEEKCFNDLAPRFVHRTFAEYLFAQFFVEMIRKSSIYRPFLNVQETLLDIVIKSVLATIPYTETPFTNPHFQLTTKILLAEVRNPVIAYFMECQLRKVPPEDINTELVPKFFRVRHPKADNHIQEILDSCLSKNYSVLANYFLHLYTPPATSADNLIKVATKYADSHLINSLIKSLLLNHCFEEIFPIKNYDVSSLEIAAQRGNYSVFEILFKLTQSNIANHYHHYHRLLHFVVAYSFQDSTKVLNDKIQIINMILSTKKDFLEMTVSPEQTTPLLQPNLHFELFKHLVDNGANINAVTALGETCLHKLLQPVERKVVINSSTFYNALELMQDKRFEGFIQQDTFKKTSLQLSVESMDISESILNIYRKQGVILEILDDDLESLLFYSVRNHSSGNIVRLLLKFGFKITATNIFKQNLLHVCAEVGNYIVLQYLMDSCKISKSLVNEPDANGNTPLHISMLHETPHRQKIINILLFNGADPNAVNDKGNIPLLEGLEVGNGLTVSLSCIKIMNHFGLNVSKQIASTGLFNIMCNLNLTSLDIDDNFRSVFTYFVHCGGEICSERINNYSINNLYSFIVGHIEQMHLLDRTKLTKQLGLDFRDLNKVRQISLGRICQALLNVSESHSFIMVRQIFRNALNNCSRFVTAPYKVMQFLRVSSEKLLVVKTSYVEIFIARIHDTIDSSIPCVDVNNLDSILEWSVKVIIVRGYDKGILDNFCKGKTHKLICFPKHNEFETVSHANVLDDKLLWNHLSFHFQQDLLKDKSNVGFTESGLCDGSLALAIIQNIVTEQLLLSNSVYKCIKTKSAFSVRTYEKLICMAIRTLFPSLRHHILEFETELEYVDLRFLVNNFVLLKVSHGLTYDYVFATKTAAAYFVALAVNNEISNTVGICNEVLEAIIRMPGSESTQIPKENCQSNKFYSKHVILFLNCMQSVPFNMNDNKERCFAFFKGNNKITQILKLLLLAHVLPCFSYINNTLFVESFLEMNQNSLVILKENSLTETMIWLKSVKYASFFTIYHVMNANEDIFNNLTLFEIRECFSSVVTDTYKENLFLVADRIDFINKFISKCRRFSISKDIVSNSILASKVHWQLVKQFIKIGADPYTVDITKQTIAHKCTAYLSPIDYHSLVDFLIKSKLTAMFSHECCNGETPVESILRNLAVIPETLKVLIENDLISKKLLSDPRQNLMYFAIKGGQSREVLEIIYSFALNKTLYEVAVFDAIEFENVEALKYIIELNADFSIKASMGRSALHYCIKFCQTYLFVILDILVKMGADVNMKDANGHTPLWYAWYENRQGSPNQHLIEYLTQIGALYS